MPLLIPSSLVVLLTGSTGYLGNAVAVNLLENGLNVRASVRTEAQGEAFKNHYSQYKDQYSYMIVPSITDEGAFDKAVVGVDAIIHTASPVPDMDSAIDHSATLLPAIQGTTSILHSALLEPKIKTFVLTSSVASVRDFKKPPIKGDVLTSENWNSVTYEEALALPQEAVMAVYAASKALAEKSAWEFMIVNKPSFTLTAILPTWCLGKSYEPGLKTVKDLRSSSGMTAGWSIDQASLPTGPAVFFKYVNIDDVARAHVQAVLRPETAGKRYLLVGGSASLIQVTYLLRKNFPEHLDRIAPAESEKIPEPYGLDGAPAETAFGFTYQTLEETVKAWGEQIFSL